MKKINRNRIDKQEQALEQLENELILRACWAE